MGSAKCLITNFRKTISNLKISLLSTTEDLKLKSSDMLYT